MKSWEIKSR